MDTLTHALSGALLVYVASSSIPKTDGLPLRIQMTTGFAAAVFPDLDFVLRAINTLTYLNWHQGPTHSLLMLPIWACLLAQLFSRITRKRYSWKAFFIPACLGMVIHIAGDFVTAYGTMLFAPLTFQRFSLPLVFVVDLWFSLFIIAGLISAFIFPRQKIVAILAFIGLFGYVLFLWILQERAINTGQAFAKALGHSHTKINVLPQPFSPLHWKIIVNHGPHYHVALINLSQTKDTITHTANANFLQKFRTAYQHAALAHWQYYSLLGEPSTDTTLTRTAWYQSDFADFRRFSVFPALERIQHKTDEVCVWFFDLRFSLPLLPPSFRYGMCRNHATHKWRMLQHESTFWID